ncbi:MAG: protein translocase subunit SecF [Methanosarcinales archaeon]|nr:protein translocase subunit SecF [Methanosarcinales archaeon]
MKNINIEQYIESYLKKVSTTQMIIIPLVLLLLSLVILGWSFISTGSPVELGIEFTGGTTVTVESTLSFEEVQQKFTSQFPDTPPISARDAGGGRVMLKFAPMDEAAQMELNEYLTSNFGKEISLQQISALYGQNLQISAIKAVIYAFLGMAVLVFIIFRSVVPSGAVVLSAFSDIVIAATLMNLFGIALSLGTVAALLMLIGYSIDSDILLTTRLLKRRGKLDDKIKGAMKTGLTMTTTTIAAIFILFLVSTFAQYVSSFSRIDIISDISAVLLLGLATDLMNTWMLNTGILKWYMGREVPIGKKRRGGRK